MSGPPGLSMRGISKRFPGVVALAGVDFDLRPGEVHALVGENGAGKSTLMKVLSGAQPADEGEITLDGRPVSLTSPAAAARLGIGMIYQELCLAPHLTVGENLLLGHEPRRHGLVDFRALHARAQAELDRLHSGLSSRRRVADLGIAQQQMVEIARALCREARFLIMDEPTAALSEAEVERLFATIRRLRAEGVGVAYISHRLEEVLALGDRVTVLRDGRHVATQPVGETSLPELVRLMVGRELEEIYPRRQARLGEELLRVEGLSRPPDLRDISLALHAGEVLGLAGLVGAGRTELVRALFGAEPPSAGRVLLRGRELRLRSPHEAIAAGLALLTEDRKRDGLCLGLPLRANLTLASLRQVTRRGVLQPRPERDLAQSLLARLGVRARGPEQPARDLSGGNQQKLVLGKWLASGARVFLFDEPTQGVDVGARAEIYRLIEELVEAGAGVLLVSSYLPELLALSDRVLVMASGRLTGELTRAEATPERIMHLATTEET